MTERCGRARPEPTRRSVHWPWPPQSPPTPLLPSRPAPPECRPAASDRNPRRLHRVVDANPARDGNCRAGRQVDESLLHGAIHKIENPKVNGGGRRRGGQAAAAAGSTVAEAAAAAGRGRSRGAKRSTLYAGLASYDAHFSRLVSLELQYEKVRRPPGGRGVRGRGRGARTIMPGTAMDRPEEIARLPGGRRVDCPVERVMVHAARDTSLGRGAPPRPRRRARRHRRPRALGARSAERGRDAFSVCVAGGEGRSAVSNPATWMPWRGCFPRCLSAWM